jgi:hypothetical protein
MASCPRLAASQLQLTVSHVTRLSLSLMLRPTVSWPVCLGIKHPPGTYDKIFNTVRGFVDVGCSLWREDRSVVYNCCWPSPERSFSSRSPVGLATIFYCLRFGTSLSVPSYDFQGYGGGIWPRLHTGHHLSGKLLYITSREPNRDHCLQWFHSVYSSFQKSLPRICLQPFNQNHSNGVFSMLLPSNGRLFLLDYSGFQPPHHIIKQKLLHLMESNPKFTYMLYSATAEDNVYHKNRELTSCSV